jgi:hypothetical protein
MVITFITYQLFGKHMESTCRTFGCINKSSAKVHMSLFIKFGKKGDFFAKNSSKKGRLTPKKVKVYGNLSVTVAYDTQ